TTELPHPRDVVSREIAILDEHRRRLPAANKRELAARLRDATLFERRDGGCKELQYIARRQVHPARDRQHAIRMEAIEIRADRLDGVKITLRQRVEARRRRTECVEQRHIDEV